MKHSKSASSPSLTPLQYVGQKPDASLQAKPKENSYCLGSFMAVPKRQSTQILKAHNCSPRTHLHILNRSQQQQTNILLLSNS